MATMSKVAHLSRPGIRNALLPGLQPSLRTIHSSRTVEEPEKGPMPIDPADDPKKGGDTWLSAILYGSKAAKAEGLVSDTPTTTKGLRQHSKVVGRGKYVHEKVTHNIIPSKRDEYLEASDKYFTALRARSGELGGIKLTGSWETIVGNVGEYTHILEYEGYKGYDSTGRLLRNDPEMTKLLKDILPHVQSRQHQIVSEFSFWPSSPPRDSGYPDGGIFEMRTYQLQPGKLLEWEGAWRRGLEARRRFVQPVGAFFSQVGQLHEVHHIWQYPDMETRKATREAAWSVGSWSDTVQEDTDDLNPQLAQTYIHITQDA